MKRRLRNETGESLVPSTYLSTQQVHQHCRATLEKKPADRWSAGAVERD